MATISIIIPAKNEEVRLPRCLSAARVLHCNKYEVELIVVDNGSSDGTVGVAAAYGASTHICPSRNISSLRNTGAQYSRGNFLVFIDADIVMKPDYLQKAIMHFDDPLVGAVTGLQMIPDNSSWVAKTWYLQRSSRQDVQTVYWAASGNMIIRRELFLSVGGFSEDLITCEDVDLGEKIRRQGYSICFDRNVQVEHLGEAQSLRRYFWGELWRGVNSVQLLRKHPRSVRRWLSFLPVALFVWSMVCAIVFVSFSHYGVASLLITCGLMLPLSRAVIVSMKHHSVVYIPKLFIIWCVYYAARGICIVGAGRNRRKER